MPIYFLQPDRGGPIKIGRAAHVQNRVFALQAACPYELKLLATMPGGTQEERALHRRFDAYRERSEWFRACRELCDLVASLGGAAIPEDEAVVNRCEAPEQEPTTPGARLRALRTAVGLHQHSFADAVGIDRVVICKIECDKHKVTSYRYMAGLARVFGLSTDEFAGFLDGRIPLRDARLRAVPLRAQEAR
ncbi:GIY-YIG nuclease family protein [Sorangium sp. So ce134]